MGSVVFARLEFAFAIAVFAACSVGAKALVLSEQDVPAAERPADADIENFLASEGYTLSLEPNPVIAWTIGQKGACKIRVGDVTPDGWFQAIVKEQTRGETLKFAFNGTFYDSQPTFETRMAKYKARVLKYLSIDAAPVLIRAVSTTTGCAEDVFSVQFARGLSQHTDASMPVAHSGGAS